MHGNIHAPEVAGCCASVHLIQHLLAPRSQKKAVKTVLDRMTYYIIPCINPDGAEKFLCTPQRDIRSYPRPVLPENMINAIIPEDINGDGLILQMRVEHEDGDMRPSDIDSRLLVKRKPCDTKGPFYHVYLEGTVVNWDGGKPHTEYPQYDLNRDFSAGWTAAYQSEGAGEYAFSRPETRALADFVESHHNICFGLGYHCGPAGVLGYHGTDELTNLKSGDQALLEDIGKMGERLTGLPLFPRGRYLNDPPRKFKPCGEFKEWGYEMHGWIVFNIELGMHLNNAGYSTRDIFWGDSYLWHDAEHKVFDWIKKNGDKTQFIDWKPFEHRQLGRVELGGWHPLSAVNPLPSQLEKIITGTTNFILAQSAMVPSLCIRQIEIKELAPALFHLSAEIYNTGSLATNITAQGLVNQRSRPILLELSIPAGANLKLGKARQFTGNLAGHQTSSRFEWLIEGNGAATIRVSCPRAGTDIKTVNLGKTGKA